MEKIVTKTIKKSIFLSFFAALACFEVNLNASTVSTQIDTNPSQAEFFNARQIQKEVPFQKEVPLASEETQIKEGIKEDISMDDVAKENVAKEEITKEELLSLQTIKNLFFWMDGDQNEAKNLQAGQRERAEQIEIDSKKNEAVSSLSHFYNAAIEYEPKLKSQFFAEEAKKEDINSAFSKLYPQLEVMGGGTSREYVDNIYGRDVKEEYTSLTFSARQAIYRPEIFTQISQAELKHLHQQFYYEKQKQDLAFKVTDAYISILKAYNSIDVAKSYEDANLARHDQIAKKLEMNLSNKMDFLESKVSLERSKIALKKELDNLEVAKLKLKNLTGIVNIQIPSIVFEELDTSKMVLELGDNPLLKNLDLAMADINVQYSKKEEELAKYGHYPKVDLSASKSYYDTQDRNFDYKEDQRLMIEFRLPIYQGGATESAIARAKYMQQASIEEFKGVEKEVALKLEESVVLFNAAKSDIELYKHAETSAKLYLEAATKGYEKGLKNLIDVEDAKTKLYETRFKLIDAVYNFSKSYLNILNIKGELTTLEVENLENFILGYNSGYSK